MKLRGTRVQYGFLLHRNCFLLINMLENFIKFQNYKILRKTFLKFIPACGKMLCKTLNFENMSFVLPGTIVI